MVSALADIHQGRDYKINKKVDFFPPEVHVLHR